MSKFMMRKETTHTFSLILLCISSILFSLTPALADNSEAPPTNIRKDAPTPATIEQAKIALGFSPEVAKTSFDTGAEFYFTIIDSQFEGIDEWLLTHPKIKNKVKYKNLKKSKKSSTGSHGFNVFEVAHAVMPQAKFLLLEVGTSKEMGLALDVMKKEGSYFASRSLGSLYNTGAYDPSKIYSWLAKLEKYQITLLNSAGNYRKTSHSFPYSDKNNNGFLEFSNNRDLQEENLVYLGKEREAKFTLSWNEWPKHTSAVELQLLKSGKVVASKRSKEGEIPTLVLKYTSPTKGKHTLRIKAQSSAKTAFTLFTSGISTKKGNFNGQESLNTFSQYESPFLISVGSFGLTEHNKLEPSLFSSIGHSYIGEVSPHILGPGQLIVNKRTRSGTSFSTPFVAALYSIFADYNIKNIIEASSNHSLYKSGLSSTEKGRWGTPQLSKLFNNNCINSTRVENLRHKIEGEELILDFDFSRNCMEKMEYWLHVTFNGEKHLTSNIVRTDTVTIKRKGKEVAVKGWIAKKSEKRDIVKEATTISIPMKYFTRSVLGKKITPHFEISTAAQWDPVTIGEKYQPNYSILLPQSKTMKNDATGLKALDVAKQANSQGAYKEAITLASRALDDKSLTEKQRFQAYDTLSTSYISQSSMAGLIDTANSAFKEGITHEKFLFSKGMAHIATNNLGQAQGNFETCMDVENSESLLACGAGLAIVHRLQGDSTFSNVTSRLGNKADNLANTINIYAQVIAMFIGEIKPESLLKRVKKISKDRAKTVLNLTAAHYYLGQIALVNNDVEEARKNFERSSQAGGVILERALARHWLTGKKETIENKQNKPQALPENKTNKLAAEKEQPNKKEISDISPKEEQSRSNVMNNKVEIAKGAQLYSCTYKKDYPSSPYKIFSFSYDESSKKLQVINHPNAANDNELKISRVINTEEKLSFVLRTSLEKDEGVEVSHDILHSNLEIKLIHMDYDKRMAFPAAGKCKLISKLSGDATNIITGEAEIASKPPITKVEPVKIQKKANSREQIIDEGIKQLLKGNNEEALDTFLKCPIHDINCLSWVLISNAFLNTEPFNGIPSHKIDQVDVVLDLMEQMSVETPTGDREGKLLFAQRTNFIGVKKTSYEQLLARSKELNDERYTKDISFYLGLWKLVENDKEAAISHFQESIKNVNTEKETEMQRYSQLWLEMLEAE